MFKLTKATLERQYSHKFAPIFLLLLLVQFILVITIAKKNTLLVIILCLNQNIYEPRCLKFEDYWFQSHFCPEFQAILFWVSKNPRFKNIRYKVICKYVLIFFALLVNTWYLAGWFRLWWELWHQDLPFSHWLEQVHADS